MKYTILIIICSLSLSLMSCESNENENPPLDSDTFVRAKIDGVNWEAEIFTASYVNEIVSIVSGVIGNSSIEISIQNARAIGTYQIGNVSIGAYQIGMDNFTETFTTAGALGSGTITITILNSKRIEGMFTFDGGNGLGDTKSISNGEFKINLSK